MNRIIVPALILGMLSTGCGAAAENIAENITEEAIEQEMESSGGNVDVDIDEDGGYSVSVEGEDESGSFQSGTGATIPEEFPLPYPGGGTVVLSMVQTEGDQTASSATLQYGAGSFDDIVSFYDDHFANQDVQRTEVSGDSQSVSWYQEDGSLNVTVMKLGEEAMLTLAVNE